MAARIVETVDINGAGTTNMVAAIAQAIADQRAADYAIADDFSRRYSGDAGLVANKIAVAIRGLASS